MQGVANRPNDTSTSNPGHSEAAAAKKPSRNQESRPSPARPCQKPRRQSHHHQPAKQNQHQKILQQTCTSARHIRLARRTDSSPGRSNASVNTTTLPGTRPTRQEPASRASACFRDVTGTAMLPDPVRSRQRSRSHAHRALRRERGGDRSRREPPSGRRSSGRILSRPRQRSRHTRAIDCLPKTSGLTLPGRSFRNTVGVPGFQPEASSLASGRS